MTSPPDRPEHACAAHTLTASELARATGSTGAWSACGVAPDPVGRLRREPRDDGGGEYHAVLHNGNGPPWNGGPLRREAQGEAGSRFYALSRSRTAVT
jgi:hypothetical protein